MSVGQNIKRMRKRIGMNAETLADKVGVSATTIYRYENGDIGKVDSVMVELIAKALGTTPAMLMGWEDRPGAFGKILPQSTSMKRIPIIGDTAAGLPIIANREYDEYITVPTDGKKFNAAVRVTGDSMEPYYHKGDLALIRYQEDVLDGQIALVCLDDEVTLKRIYHDKDAIVLVSDNRKYAPMRISLEDVPNIHLTGRAVGVIHWED